MAKTKIHVGLEIGTSKTCMVVGEVKSDGSVTIIGIGEVPSEGVLRGEIVDLSKAMQCVHDAWSLAEEQADVDILTVYLAVTGPHIKGENKRGTYRLPATDKVVTQEHMDEVLTLSRDLDLDSDQFVLHRVPGLYCLDERENLTDPRGLEGETLDVDSHIIHGIQTRLSNSFRCVREIPLDVSDVVFAPLAAAQVGLDRQSKQAGVLLIDLGAGTSDYILYVDGQLKASGCIPLGGDHISNDIATLTNIPWSVAERLKRAEGDADSFTGRTNEMVRLKGEAGANDIVIERRVLNKIVRDRMSEIFCLVRDSLPKGTFENNQCRCVRLCGGVSLMRGVGQLASEIFKVSVECPTISEEGTPSYLDDPRYFTALGLIRFAQISEAELAPNDGFLTRLWHRMIGKN